MLKNKLWLHQIVLFGVVGGLTVIALLRGDFSFDLAWLWWLLGAVIGFLFVFADRLFFNFVSEAETILNEPVRRVFENGKTRMAIEELLEERYPQKQMASRSFLFVVVWLILYLFSVTSVYYPFARGLVLGVGVHILFDLVYDYVYNRERFEEWFWQIKRTLPENEKKLFVWGSLVVFVVLSLIGVGA